jgi:hypothetical protein
VSTSAASTVGYALKFISGKYQGGEFPLKGDKQIVIGRVSADMVLAEDMVSRKHAKITLNDGGKITIEDLGSTNGTFVNGEKVKQARLKEGDRILIGTSILKLVHQRGAGGPTLEEAAAAQARRPSAITGKIEEVPLPDVLQLLRTSKKSAVLLVRSDQHGRIYLREGRVYYAVIDDNHELSPVKSFCRMLTWEKGDFELSAEPPRDFPVEIQQPLEALLIDGVRQLDEFRRVAKELPSEKARLVLPSPLKPALRTLSPEQLDVLQLVHNHGNLRSVLDRSEKDDASTANVLLHLIKKDYVRVG